MAREIDYSMIEQELQAYLRLDRHIIGVKILNTIDEYENCKTNEFKGKAYYCQMVKKATQGKAMKAKLNHMSCDTGSRMLGLKPFYEDQEDIDGWYDAGLHKTKEIADLQHQSVRPISNKTHGVVVSPMSSMFTDPDIIMIACNAYQAMRLSQAYTYSYGFVKSVELSGHCGVCFESTAKPYNKREFSISMLCSGTRFVSKWDENTLMVSFPFDQCESILEGLIKTANHVETDGNKENILSRLEDKKLPIKESLDKGMAYYYKKEKH